MPVARFLRWCAVVAACLASAAGAHAQVARDCPPGPALDKLQAPPAPGRDRGFLWVLRKDGRPLWLYGTLHVARPEWVVPGARVLGALRASDTVALELDLTDPESLLQALRPAEAGSQERILGAALAARLEAALDAACAPPAIKAQRPFMQAMALTVMEARRAGLHAELSIDAILTGLAQRTGKAIVGLETAAQQMAALTPESPDDERELVRRMLEQVASGEAQQMLQRTADVWARGDFDVLADYPRWCKCTDTAAERRLMARLLDGRNAAIAGKIAALHAQGKRVFAGVGALHFTGAKGLVRLLAAQGFEVERIAFERD